MFLCQAHRNNLHAPYCSDTSFCQIKAALLLEKTPQPGAGIKVSPWTVVDGYCAMRYVVGTNPEDVCNRVAFIEKTPRVRVHPKEEKDDVFFNWDYGPKGSGGSDEYESHEKLGQYGFCQASRDWCDERLLELGYILE